MSVTLTDPRAYRQAASGVAHIVRETLIERAPWSATNLIQIRGGLSSYCGLDVSALPAVADEPSRVCHRCDLGYYADEEAE